MADLTLDHDITVDKLDTKMGSFVAVKDPEPVAKPPEPAPPAKKKKPKVYYTNASCWSRWSYSWMNRVVARGRDNKLNLEDLQLPKQLHAEQSYQRFELEWQRQLREKEVLGTPVSLVRAFRNLYSREFAVAGIFKLGWTICVWVSAFYLVRSLVAFSDKDSTIPSSNAYIFSVSFFVAAMLASICEQQLQGRSGVLSVRIGAVLTMAIYRKALKLEGISSKVSDVLNLVSNDSFRVQDTCLTLHLLWGSPIETAATMALLVVLTGVFGLVALALSLITFGLLYLTGQRVSKLREKNIVATDERVSFMHELLHAIKMIKFYAWEQSFFEIVFSLRKKELSAIRKGQMLKSINMLIVFLTPPAIALVLFTMKVVQDGELPSVLAFTTLSLFNTLRFPLVTLPRSIKSFSEAKAAIHRLEDFLCHPDMHSVPRLEGSGHVLFDKAEIAYAKLDDDDSDDEGVKPDPLAKLSDEKKQVDPQFLLMPNDLSARTTLMQFVKPIKPLPPHDQARYLKIFDSVSFFLPTGKTLALVGPVASGKTTLIQALLGEARTLSGTISSGGPICYVPQHPWIQAGTIKDNILFGLPMDEGRYRRAVFAAALERDFEILPLGDMTVVAERGINLSGGQRQRISIARAAYSEANIYLLDGPLSAVDYFTASHIIEHCMKGMLKGKTQIMVTHQLQLVHHFDYLGIIKDCKLLYYGPPSPIVLRQHFTFFDEVDTEPKADEIALKAPVYSSLPQQRALVGLTDAHEAWGDADEDEHASDSPRSPRPNSRIGTPRTSNRSLELYSDSDSDSENRERTEHRPRRRRIRADQLALPNLHRLQAQATVHNAPKQKRSTRYSFDATDNDHVRRPRSASDFQISHVAHLERKTKDLQDTRDLAHDHSHLPQAGQKPRALDPYALAVPVVDAPPPSSSSASSSSSSSSAEPSVAGPAATSALTSEATNKVNMKDFHLDVAPVLEMKIEKGPPPSNMKTFMDYVNAGKPFWFAFSMSVFAITQVCRIMSDWWIAQWTSNSFNRDNRFYNILYLILVSLFACFLFIRGKVFFHFAKKASKSLHNEMYHRILRAPVSYFTVTPLGAIVSAFSVDQDIVDEALPDVIHMTTIYLAILLTTILLVCVVLPLYLTITAALPVSFFFLVKYYISTALRLKELVSDHRAPVVTQISESTDGIAVVRAFASEERFTRVVGEAIDKYHTCAFSQAQLQLWLSFRLNIIGALMVLMTAIFVVIEVGNKNIVAATAGLAISNSLQQLVFYQWFVTGLAEAASMLNSVRRIKEFTEKTPMEAAAINPDCRPAESWPASGAIEYKNVTMSYFPDQPPAVKRVSFKIKPREKIGIIGRTGSGKSSLVMALFRQCELSEGAIMIDDCDISKFGLQDLRSRLAIIPQEPVMFRGTIRTNLDPFRQYDDQQCWASLEVAHLANDIKSMPLGLEAVVEDMGRNFSLGQRQLMCLARAALRKSSVLVLDEATSQMDLETDRIILDTIKQAFADRTVLVIAHRLDTIIHSDRILALSAGELVEFDSPKNLLANPESIFAQLVAQAGDHAATLRQLVDKYEVERQERAAAAAAVAHLAVVQED